MKRIVKTIFLLQCLFLIISHAPSFGQSEEAVKAPSFVLRDLDGREIDSKDYEGNFLVIHIATTWCPYCNAEAPHLQKLSETYASRGVKVLIIDVKEPVDLVKQQLKEKHHLTFPILLDENGAVASLFAPKDVLPELARDEIMLASNILVDPAGNIRYMSLLDTRNFDSRLIEINSLLDELLNENY